MGNIQPPMCTGVISRGESGRGVIFNPHHHLASRFRMSGAMLLLPISVYVAWTEASFNVLFSEVLWHILSELL